VGGALDLDNLARLSVVAGSCMVKSVGQKLPEPQPYRVLG
jgi:hypothetical protein